MIRTKRRRHLRIVRFGWLALALISVSALAHHIFVSQRRFAEPPVMAAADGSEAPLRPAAERRLSRPVYPYSVIPGGVYSVAEFRLAIGRDSVVSAHYSGFHAEGLRMTNAAKPVPMYTSYRIGNAVYWTRYPVRIAAGEALITDGTSFARARCGNRLSSSPRGPIAYREPKEIYLETADRYDFSEQSAADSSNFDLAVALPGSVVPASALAFEIFPAATLSEAPAPSGASGNWPAQWPWPSGPASGTPPGMLSATVSPPPVSIPGGISGPAPVTVQPFLPGQSGSPLPPDQLPIETPPWETSSATPPWFSQTPPVPPGLITGTDSFPDSGGQEGGSSAGSNPEQPVTTTSQSPPSGPPVFAEPAPPSGPPVFTEPAPPGVNPVPTIPGSADAPEPGTWTLVGAGVIFLWIAARRRGAI
jgi:hypothetical protein